MKAGPLREPASPTFVPNTRSVDGTHPSAAGYAEWARLIDR